MGLFSLFSPNLTNLNSTQITNVPTTDIYPPSKVTDLKVELLESTVRLSFTAPGEDLDDGTGTIGVGGSIAQWLAYLLPDPAVLGFIPSITKLSSVEKWLMLLRLIKGAA